MTETPTPKPGILDIAPYVGGKSSIAGVAEPMKLSSNENALGAGGKARAAYEAALKNIHIYPDGRATKLRAAVADLRLRGCQVGRGRCTQIGQRCCQPRPDQDIVGFRVAAGHPQCERIVGQ